MKPIITNPHIESLGNRLGMSEARPGGTKAGAISALSDLETRLAGKDSLLTPEERTEALNLMSVVRMEGQKWLNIPMQARSHAFLDAARDAFDAIRDESATGDTVARHLATLKQSIGGK